MMTVKTKTTSALQPQILKGWVGLLQRRLLTTMCWNRKSSVKSHKIIATEAMWIRDLPAIASRFTERQHLNRLKTSWKHPKLGRTSRSLEFPTSDASLNKTSLPSHPWAPSSWQGSRASQPMVLSSCHKNSLSKPSSSSTRWEAKT